MNSLRTKFTCSLKRSNLLTVGHQFENRIIMLWFAFSAVLRRDASCVASCLYRVVYVVCMCVASVSCESLTCAASLWNHSGVMR